MGSPRHLWSGDWQDESAAAAARRRATASTTDAVPTPDQPQPDAGSTRSGRPRTLVDDMRRLTAAWSRKQWTTVAALLLAVALIAATAVAVLHDGNGRASNTSSSSVAQLPPRGQRPPGAGQGAPGSGQIAPGSGQIAPGSGQLAPGSGQLAPGTGLANPSGSSPAPASAWLGVDLQSSATGGALVEGIVAGGPADAAALRPGDVIVGIDNRSVDSPEDLTNAIAGLNPGETVTIRFRRGGADYTTQVTLDARPMGYSSP